MGIHFKPQQSKSGIKIKVKEFDGQDDTIEHEIKEMFIGHRTIFSLVGFAVGGTVAGHALFRYGEQYMGLAMTLFLSIVVFTISGIVLRAFYK